MNAFGYYRKCSECKFHERSRAAFGFSPCKKQPDPGSEQHNSGGNCQLFQRKWLGTIGPAIAVVAITSMNVWLGSSSRWDWCENMLVKRLLGNKLARQLDDAGDPYWAEYYRDKGRIVPKKEYNADGACMYYKRKWWKFWAPR